MTPPFRSSLFAILESYAPQLLEGKEARPPVLKPRLAAGQVGIFGVLGQSDWYSDTDYQDIRANVRRAVADPSVKTIDLVIDSPGGSVLGLPETADAIHAANRVKPVRAFVTGIAASAAYWLASQASTVTLTPSGEVGSVGVLDLHADISKALDNAGVKVTAVTAGEHKTERAPFVPLSDDARAHMQAGVNAWYGDFLSAIRRGRGARVPATGNFGGGRMLSSRDALAAGMVDFIGGAF
ncbi:MAG TPA: S49 family peptidase [Terriglobales bacterium]|nr:S49 family peptidase [Terriglobales bacterium]